MAAEVGTGIDYEGDNVAVAFNLKRCGPKAKKRKPECFTVFEGGTARTRGKVSGYVDNILLQDVDFISIASGVERIRRTQSREVIAWVRGTVLDPDKPSVKRRLGNLDHWTGIAYNPFKGAKFIRTDTMMPVDHAEFAFFDSDLGRGVAKFSRSNHHDGELIDEGWLLGLIDARGGDVTGMGDD